MNQNFQGLVHFCKQVHFQGVYKLKTTCLFAVWDGSFVLLVSLVLQKLRNVSRCSDVFEGWLGLAEVTYWKTCLWVGASVYYVQLMILLLV